MFLRPLLLLTLFVITPTLCQDLSSDISMSDISDPTDPSLSGSSASKDSIDPPPSSTNDAAPKQTITSKGQCDFDISDDKGTKYHYELDALTRPNGNGDGDYTKEIQVGPNIQFVYRMNMCANTKETCQNEPSPATESLKIPAGETCRILGRLVDGSDPIAANHGTYELVPSLNTDVAKNPSGRDLVITYNNGDLCDPAKQTMRSVSIHLVCDNSLTPAQSVFKDVKKEATCNTEYIFESKFACPTAASHNPKRWLIMGIIGFAFYFIVGAIVLKYHYKEEETANLIIHKEFWTDVPSLAKEGCSYTYEAAASSFASVKENGFGLPSFGSTSSNGDAPAAISSTAGSPSAYGSGNGIPASDYA